MNGGLSRPWLPFAVVAALCSYLWWHFQYPFWFIWDMDHTVLVDTVLIQSGKWPVHLHHPGFGLYLPLKWSHLASYVFGLTSILGISDLEKSVGPLLGVAELTDYLRLHSPFLALGVVLLLWRSLTLLLPLSRAQELGLFVLLAAQAALLYHSTMIRTELYAVFWWAMAVHAFSRAAPAESSRREAAWAAAGGFFLSLSLLSKIQAIVYLGAACVLFALFRHQAGKHSGPNSWAAPRLRRITAANLAFATFLIVGAALRRPYGATFTEAYPINFVGVAFLSANLLLFAHAWGYVPFVFRRLGRLGEEWLPLATLVMSGFLLAYLAHFAMYASPGTSYRYMLLDAKMVFFRNSTDPGLMHLAARWDNFRQLIAYHPALYVAFAGVFGAAFLARPKQLPRPALALLLLICLFSLFAGSRAFLRDLLWAETLVLFLLLWAAGVLSTQAKGFRLLPLLVFGLVLAGSLNSFSRLRRDLDANYNIYGWSPHRNFDGTYWEGHVQFAPPIHARYGPEGSASRQDAFLQARAYREVRRTAEFVLANARLDMKNLGLCAEGQSVFQDEPASRFGRVPEAIRGGILVDPSGLRLDARVAYEARRVNVNDERLDKRLPEPAPDTYSLLIRPDLDIYVATESDLADLVTAKVLTDAGSLELEAPKGTRLRLYRVAAYLQVPRARLGARHFLVIRQKLDT